ncbi:MAG: hypothetical protein ACXWIN_00125 [Burkholderiaceae bacterium]
MTKLPDIDQTLTVKSPSGDVPKEDMQREIVDLCATCPVSPPDGTARPGQMSDCFFDLPASTMRTAA